MPRLPKTLYEHPDSSRLAKAIRTCWPFVSTFVGDAFRATSYEWANKSQFIDGIGSRRYGGRWNPPGSFKVVYLSFTPETAIAEALATNRRGGLPDSEGLPLVVTGVRVELARVLDITSKNVEAAIGLTKEELTIAPYDQSPIEIPSQAIGRLCRAEGCQGVLVPSAALPGSVNIVVFLGRATAGKIQLINPGKLPPKRTKSTRKTSRRGP